MDDDQQSEVVVIGFAHGELALAEEFVGLGIAGENFDFRVAAVRYVAKQRDLWHDETDERDGGRRRADERVSPVDGENSS